jgi:hypothetical protein
VPVDHRRLSHNKPGAYGMALADLERDTIRRVNRDMRGQDVGQVHLTLASQLRGRFPGVDFDDMHLGAIAAAISQGTLNV